MKQIDISIKALRILYVNLENNQKGYNKHQLRRIDKVLADIFDPLLAEYTGKIEAFANMNRNKVKSLDPESLNFRSIVNLENIRMEDSLKDVDEKIGKNKVTALLEDSDFEIVKEKFNATEGFMGSKEVRRLVLEIDDALENAKTAAPSKNEEVKKNSGQTPSSDIKNETSKPASPAEPTANAANI